MRDLHDSFFGLVAHFSLWDAALTALVLRKLLASPLHGAEKNLSLYLNPEPAQWASRVVQDVAQGVMNRFLDRVRASGLVEAGGTGRSLESLAALAADGPTSAEQTVSIPDKSWRG